MYDDPGSNQSGYGFNDGDERSGQSSYSYGNAVYSDAQSTKGAYQNADSAAFSAASSAASGDHSESTVKAKKKKSGGVGKFFAIVFSGLLFGVCAGAAIVAVMRLFPAKTDDTQYLGHKPSVEIQKAEPIMPEGDAKAEEKEDAASEEINKDEDAGQALSSDDEAEEGEKEGAKVAQAVNTEESSADTMTVVTDVTRVVDSVMPSVVSIFGTYEVTETYWGFEMQRQEDGSGSGIIVGENDDELLVVTNNHVVADSTSLSVQFIDNEKCSAQVKGTDTDSDLAVIAVRMTELKDATKEKIRIATLGDSDTLKVGEPAIAIGNALGYGQSVTTGVISALNRTYSQDESGNSTELIQTDAAINPGNSGGALLNIYGEVIGINASKIGGMVIEGMGYAIPISTAKPILEDLMAKKTRAPVDDGQKGYLGISGLNVTEDVRDTYGLPMGVYIAQVFDSTPAQRAGLKKGDIITSFDGEAVETMEELSKLLDSTPAGTEVELTVMSSFGAFYQERTIKVTLDAQYR